MAFPGREIVASTPSFSNIRGMFTANGAAMHVNGFGYRGLAIPVFSWNVNLMPFARSIPLWVSRAKLIRGVGNHVQAHPEN